MSTEQPQVEEAEALDGKIFALLNERELEVFKFFTARGRKFGVMVEVINEADPKVLVTGLSREQAEQVMQRNNSRVFVKKTGQV